MAHRALLRDADANGPRKEDQEVKVRSGQTRTVLLIGRWAIKVPRLANGWRFFLMGMLANANERRWSGFDDRLCPVLWCAPMGLMLCMRRAEPWPDGEPLPEMKSLPFLDHQTSNFGLLDGKVVSIDYGETIESIRCPDCGKFWDECDGLKSVVEK